MTRSGAAAVAPAPSRDEPSGGGGRALLWIVAAATLAMLAMSLWDLGGKSLSYDESVTVGIAHAPWRESLRIVSRYETNQAPYYLLFSGWYEVGQSEAVMRLLSVAFAVATPAMVFVVGRRLVSARAGAIAAVLVALNGLALEWAQELRSYSMAMFLVSAMTYLLARSVAAPDDRRWPVAYAVVAAVAIYTHFLVACVVAAHGLSLLLLRPVPRRTAARAGAVLGLLFLPVVVYLLTRQRDPLDYLEAPSLRHLFTVLADVAGRGKPQLVVMGALVAVGAVAAWAAVRRRPGTSAAWGRALPTVWLVVPVAALVVSTYTVKPLLVSRYLVVVIPALCLAVAVGVEWVAERRRGVAAAMVAAAVLVSAHGAASYVRSGNRTEFRDATAYVLDAAAPDDVIVVVPAPAGGAIDYYQRRMGGTLTVLEPAADDPSAGPTLWEIERVLETPLVWDPMPSYPEWRDRWYAPADEHRLSDDVVVRRFIRRT